MQVTVIMMMHTVVTSVGKLSFTNNPLTLVPYYCIIQANKPILERVI